MSPSARKALLTGLLALALVGLVVAGVVHVGGHGDGGSLCQACALVPSEVPEGDVASFARLVEVRPDPLCEEQPAGAPAPALRQSRAPPAREL